MSELRPCFVSAPLTIQNADRLDTNTIYVFDYDDSFIDSENKPKDLINYLESVGGMVDIFVSKDVNYKEREDLLLYYLNASSFFNIYSLTATLISVLFKYKEIRYENNHCIFTDEEISKFINNNSGYIKKLIRFYDSLFLIMLLFSSKEVSSVKQIKNKFPSERITDEEFGANVCNPLIDKDFYKYYNKHIGNDLYYYSFMFDNNLYKSRNILDLLSNKNNELLSLLIDLDNKKFQEFISIHQNQ